MNALARMPRSLLAFALTPLVALGAAAAARAAGGSAAPPSPPAVERSPLDVANDHYNRGLRSLERAQDLEDKAASPSSDAEKLRSKAAKERGRAIENFQEAVDAFPRHYQAWSSLGFALRRTGDYDASLTAYDRAIAISPRYAEAVEYRAEAYLAVNRLEEAKEAYLQLFAADRTRADELLSAMKRWVASPPAGTEEEVTAAFAAWVAEREELAEQTASVGGGSGRRWD